MANRFVKIHGSSTITASLCFTVIELIEKLRVNRNGMAGKLPLKRVQFALNTSSISSTEVKKHL
jgi:hypothetical protein